MMANLQHSIESLEKQDLPNSEIFDIMSSTVNSQLKESLWFHITMWNNSPNNSEQALQQGDISKTAETPGRKADAFSSGKIQRNQTIPGPGSLGFCLQKKTISFKSTFSLTLSPLSGRPSRFRFSANIDEDFEAEKRGFNGDFPELPKKTQSQINDFNVNLNIKRKAFLLRNEKYFKTIKVVSWFIQKTHRNVLISIITLFLSGNLKIMLRRSLDYEIIITLLSAMHLGSFHPSTQHRLFAALTVFYLWKQEREQKKW